MPLFAHIPILKQFGPGKMSKRDKGALIEEYEQRFMPDAVRNYICLLGWNPKDDQEKMQSKLLLSDLILTKSTKGMLDLTKQNYRPKCRDIRYQPAI